MRDVVRVVRRSLFTRTINHVQEYTVSLCVAGASYDERTTGFHRQLTMPYAIDSVLTFFKHVCQLFDQIWDKKSVRRVGVTLGISYATATRFHKPKLVPFDSDLSYDKKGPASIQAGDTSWLDLDNGTSEDYLNLNVWAPSGVKEPLPVVVYIHGGGFE